MADIEPRLRRWIPILDWLPGYPRTDLTSDLRAGLTVAVLVIPQSMAYAALAGVPAITGLYSAMAAMLIYAVLGTSRFISVGPVAIDSLLTAAAVAPLADGDAGRYLAYASLLALLVGALQSAAGFARLGAAVNLLSVPVISGFTSAAALTIAVSQLTGLLGLQTVRSSSTFVDSLQTIAPALDRTDGPTALIGLGSLALLVALRRWVPRLPGPLVVLALATTLVVTVAQLSRVARVGQIPAGIPVPALPDVAWADVRTLAPTAAAIALISIMESISTGTAFARRSRTTINPDSELVAVGMANVGTGLVQGFPVAGGLSRGAVNVAAGARSQMSGIVAAVIIAVSLFTLTGVLALLPQAALAAVIILAVAGLIDVRGAIAIGRVRRSDQMSLFVTALATLALGPVPGLGVGVAVSVLLFLRHAIRPHVPELGQIPGQPVFRNVTRHDVTTWPDLVLLRVDAPLSFVSARPVTDRIASLTRGRPELRAVILDFSAVTTADYTGIDALRRVGEDLGQAGVEVHVAAVRGPVLDIMRRHPDFGELEAAGRLHTAVPHAVVALRQRFDTDPIAPSS